MPLYIRHINTTSCQRLECSPVVTHRLNGRNQLLLKQMTYARSPGGGWILTIGPTPHLL
jgi:hypothetical protein